jgi:predicted site-specific integrase-resolvase
MEKRRLLTIPEAAKEIGMSRVVLWRHVKKGTLPSVGTDRVRLIDAAELARFHAQKRTPGWPLGRPRRTRPTPTD